jgi:glyoxalase family protein
VGIGQVTVTSLSIVPQAIAYWVGRLIAKGVTYEGPHRRFDDQLLSFKDPDGNQIELVGHASAENRQGWSDGPVPADSAIRGIHSVTLLEADLDPVAQVLGRVLGLRQTQSDAGRFRFEAPGDRANIVDVRAAGEFWSGTMGPGTVHHVAFRARSAGEQERNRDEVMRSGLGVTPVLDRKYFRSIYFREPGGVLFESATDEPGFLVDEPVEALGHGLQLPAWLEGDRPAIEGRLESLHPPSPTGIQP